jgi:hypothetical protein
MDLVPHHPDRPWISKQEIIEAPLPRALQSETQKVRVPYSWCDMMNAKLNKFGENISAIEIFKPRGQSRYEIRQCMSGMFFEVVYVPTVRAVCIRAYSFARKARIDHLIRTFIWIVRHDGAWGRSVAAASVRRVIASVIDNDELDTLRVTFQIKRGYLRENDDWAVACWPVNMQVLRLAISDISLIPWLSPCKRARPLCADWASNHQYSMTSIEDIDSSVDAEECPSDLPFDADHKWDIRYEGAARFYPSEIPYVEHPYGLLAGQHQYRRDQVARDEQVRDANIHRGGMNYTFHRHISNSNN